MAGPPRPTYHQDYIARIRYVNPLPPPACPPKFLDIPHDDLKLYCSSKFAAKLNRDQPLNIEADAELGMPIDLIGIPGVFDGDESAISANPNPPPLHPADRALLRPLNALGKQTDTTAVSFLRRTEYTTSEGRIAHHYETSSSLNTFKKPVAKSKVATKNDPANIIRHIQKGFRLANPSDGPDSSECAPVTAQERQAWLNPQHPDPYKSRVELLDTYPLIPDWAATTDTGSYLMLRIKGEPFKEGRVTGRFDERLVAAMLLPSGQSQEDMARFEQEQENHNKDPAKYKQPLEKWHYKYYMPINPTVEKAHGIKRHLSTHDPENEDEIPFDKLESGRNGFQYKFVRSYYPASQTHDGNHPYEHVVLALHDPEKHENKPLYRDDLVQKAAYFYPVSTRITLAPYRKNESEQDMVPELEQKHIDRIMVSGVDPSEEVLEGRKKKKARYAYGTEE